MRTWIAIVGLSVMLGAGCADPEPFGEPLLRRVYCLSAAEEVRGAAPRYVAFWQRGHSDYYRRISAYVGGCTSIDTRVEGDPVITAFEHAALAAGRDSDADLAEANRLLGEVADAMIEFARTGESGVVE